MQPERSPRGRDDRGGFAVAAVLFMLTSVMLLTATGYDLIRVAGDVRSAGRDGMVAEKAAEAAIARFMGERMGAPPDSQAMQLTDETRVTVYARRLARLSGHRTSYLLVGVARQGSNFPSRRTVRQFAVLEPPVEPSAVVSNVAGTLTVDRDAVVNGTDAAGSSTCAVATGNIGGAFAVSDVNTTGGNPISGSPATQIVASRAAALEELGARWDFLLGPELPVQYTGGASWPAFNSLPADSFPVIRILGDFAPTNSQSGRGALIVTGTFRPGSGFAWNGVVIAGAYGSTVLMPMWTLRGMLVTGLDGNAGPATIPAGSNLRYDRCHVMRAFAKISHLERSVGTAWTDR